MTLDAVCAATDDADAQKKKGQVCEADFYAGEWTLRQGDKDEAIRLLRLATGECPKSFTEMAAARQELKVLGAAP